MKCGPRTARADNLTSPRTPDGVGEPIDRRRRLGPAEAPPSEPFRGGRKSSSM
jgi:hypothetical protein